MAGGAPQTSSMKRRAALSAALLLAPGLLGAQSLLGVDFNPDNRPLAVAEAGLKDWMRQQPALKKKLAALAREARRIEAERPSDLRDAPSSIPSAEALRSRLEAAAPAERQALLERLPGLKADPLQACARLETCSSAPLSFDVERSAQVGPAVWALIRPWMLLQQARGFELGVLVDEEKGDRLLKLELEGEPRLALSLHAEAAPEGGFRLWLDGAPEAADWFARTRLAVLAPGR